MAEVSELSQSDLRTVIAEQRAISTRSVVTGVEDYTGGEVLDIRAFAEESQIIYRLLYRDADGNVMMILVDGGSGRAVSPGSSLGQKISEYVGANPGNGNAFGVGNRRNNGNNGRGTNNRGGNGNGGGRGRN